MSSYLKFYGKAGQGAIAQGGSSWTSNGSIVLTAIIRPLMIPTYTAPIIGVAGDTLCYHGIWLRRSPTQAPGGWFACNGRETIAGIPLERTLVEVDATTGGDPVRPGRIYKVQSVMAWDAAGGGFRMSFAVDGTIVARSSGGGGTGLSTASGDDIIRICGAPIGTGDRIGSFPIRLAHCEVIQAKVEFDRDITFEAGTRNILTVDPDSDPFDDDLTMDGSESNGALYLMNEGSGNPQDSSGYGNNLQGLRLDWASTTAEPTFPSKGVGRWSFENIRGYSLRQSDSPTVMPLPIYGPEGPVGASTDGELRLAPMSPWWMEDGEDGLVSGWNPTTQLSLEGDHVFEGDKAIHADGASAVNNTSGLQLIGSLPTSIWWVGRFYDPGGTTGTRIQRFQFVDAAFSVLAHIGVTIGISSTEYSTRFTADSTPNLASGIPISEGDHEFALYWSQPLFGNPTVRFYIDGTLVRTVTGVASNFPVQNQIRNRGELATNDDGWWDGMLMGAEGGNVDPQQQGLVEPSGSVVLPLFQPSQKVESFDSVTVDYETAGSNSMEMGGLTLTFRHSGDGGSTWGVSSALNDTNLQAIIPAGGGNDVLEVTAAFTSAMDDMASAALRQIDIGYTYLWTESEPSADGTMESSPASDPWTESGPSADGMTESDPSADPWTESDPSADPFSESS